MRVILASMVVSVLSGIRGISATAPIRLSEAGTVAEVSHVLVF